MTEAEWADMLLDVAFRRDTFTHEEQAEILGLVADEQYDEAIEAVEEARMRAMARAVHARVEEERRILLACRTCSGVPHASGIVCICGGSNQVDRELDGLRARLVAAEEDVEAFERLSELQRRRERPWIARWRRETGKVLVLPDYGEMLAWIVSKVEAAEREAERLREELVSHAKCLEELETDRVTVIERDNELHEGKDRRLADAERDRDGWADEAAREKQACDLWQLTAAEQEDKLAALRARVKALELEVDRLSR